MNPVPQVRPVRPVPRGRVLLIAGACLAAVLLAWLACSRDYVTTDADIPAAFTLDAEGRYSIGTLGRGLRVQLLDFRCVPDGRGVTYRVEVRTQREIGWIPLASLANADAHRVAVQYNPFKR